MAMHEYISEFTDLVEHAHQIKPSDSGSHLLDTQFIQGISNLYIKSRLRFFINQNQLHNLSELFGFALQENKKQNDKLNKYRPLSITNITGPQAIYLDEGSWAISIEKPTQMEIRCPQVTQVKSLKPP